MKEEISVKRKVHYQKNKLEIREKRKKFYKENKEKILKKGKERRNKDIKELRDTYIRKLLTGRTNLSRKEILDDTLVQTYRQLVFLKREISRKRKGD